MLNSADRREPTEVNHFRRPKVNKVKFKLWPKLFNRILAKRRDFRIVRIFAILEQLRQEYPEDLPILFRNRSLAEVCKSSELELFGNCIVDWSTVEWDGEPV